MRIQLNERDIRDIEDINRGMGVSLPPLQIVRMALHGLKGKVSSISSPGVSQVKEEKEEKEAKRAMKIEDIEVSQEQVDSVMRLDGQGKREEARRMALSIVGKEAWQPNGDGALWGNVVLMRFRELKR